MSVIYQRSVSVVIPAFNEQGNIQNAINSVVGAISPLVDDYQVIVIDDGSSDLTKERARQSMKNNAKIQVVSNDRNQGFGFSFARGVGLARMNYITVFPGDNDMSAESLARLIGETGSVDLVISYMAATQKRSMARKMVSRLFVVLMNFMFGLNLEYYNGPFICRTELLKSVPIKSAGLAALAECLVRMIKAGHTYKAIYFNHVGRQSERSKAFRIKNIWAVLKTMGILFKDIHWGKPSFEKALCSSSS